MDRAQETIKNWPSRSRKVAEEMIEKYGAPQEQTSRRLIWHENGPWKRTVVLRDGMPHHFPRHHLDFLEQTVNYRVPAEKIGDLIEFDGSILIDRTWGELTSCCDSEGMNILLLNLAHDIVTSQQTVTQARKNSARIRAAMQMRWPQPYTEELRFSTRQAALHHETFTPDPDHSVGVMAR